MKYSDYDFNQINLKSADKSTAFKGVGWNKDKRTKADISKPHVNILGSTDVSKYKAVIVIDIDVCEELSLEELWELPIIKRLPKTAVVKTPSGGYHLYYIHPLNEQTIATSSPYVFKTPINGKVKQIDIKGYGGLAVGVGSQWLSGEPLGSYELVTDIDMESINNSFLDSLMATLSINKDDNKKEIVRLIVDHEYSNGQRDEMARNAVGFMRKTNFEPNEIYQVIGMVDAFMKVSREQGNKDFVKDCFNKPKIYAYRAISQEIPELKQFFNKEYKRTLGIDNGKPSKIEIINEMVKKYLEDNLIITLGYNKGRIYKYDEEIGIWANIPFQEIGKDMLKTNDNIRINDNNEILDRIIKYTNKINSPFDDWKKRKLIGLRNGVYNYAKDILEPHSHENYISRRLEIDYDATKTAPFFTERIKEALNERDYQMFLEMAGYCLVPHYDLAALFIFIGEGGNGKGVYMDILRKFLGNQNVSSISLEQFGDPSNNKFLFHMLEHKYANIGSDIEKSAIWNTALLKGATGGDIFNVQKKGLDAYDINNYAKLIFAANKMPYVDDKSEGMTSRFHLLSFDKFLRGHSSKLSKTDVIDGCTTDEEMSGMFNKFINAFRLGAEMRDSFYVDEKEEKELRERNTMITDPIGWFTNEFCTFHEWGETRADVFLDFLKQEFGGKRIAVGDVSSIKFITKALASKNVKYKEVEKTIRNIATGATRKVKTGYFTGISLGGLGQWEEVVEESEV